MLTAREPSVKPLADVVRCYICCDGQHKSGNTRHFSHLPSRINGRARPQTHYTTLFAKKIQEMPRAGLSYRGKAPSSYNLSVSLRSTAPLVGEPLAKPFTLRGLPKPPLGRGGGSASALTERLSSAAAHGQASLRTTSQSRFARQGRVAAPSVCFAAARILLAAAPTAPPCFRHWRRSSPLPLVGEPLAEPFTLRGLPKPPLGRGGGSASALTERLSSSPKGGAFNGEPSVNLWKMHD